MGNDASWEAVVDVCRGSMVLAQVGVRRGTEAILLYLCLKKRPLLRYLVGATHKEHKAILGHCSSDFILSLCEIAFQGKTRQERDQPFIAFPTGTLKG